MAALQPTDIWHLSDRELSDFLDNNPGDFRRDKIRFYAPSFMRYKTKFYSSPQNDFPTISITGRSCALKCRHCGGVVLNTMFPAETPDALLNLCRELKRKGAKGCLISGGCRSDGSIPVESFIDTIAEIKQELSLTVFVHTGVIGLRSARQLKKAGVDAALIDIIGSDETIRKICNLTASVNDYSSSLKALSQAGIPYVPHVIVGLHDGKILGEPAALEMISNYDPSAIVIIAFMPLRGTGMEKVKPPRPIDIARTVAAARLMFPHKPLVLGCMRARNKEKTETEILAVRAGVDAIAFPDEATVSFVKSEGCSTSFSPMCCSQILYDMK